MDKTAKQHFRDSQTYLRQAEESADGVWATCHLLLRFRSGDAGELRRLQEQAELCERQLDHANKDLGGYVDSEPAADHPPPAAVYFELCACGIAYAALQASLFCAQEVAAIRQLRDRRRRARAEPAPYEGALQEDEQRIVHTGLLKSAAARIEQVEAWAARVDARKGFWKRLRRRLRRASRDRRDFSRDDILSQSDAVGTAIDQIANASQRIPWLNALGSGLPEEAEGTIDFCTMLAWQAAEQVEWPPASKPLSPEVAQDFVISLAMRELRLSEERGTSSTLLAKSVLACARSANYLRAMHAAGPGQPAEYARLFVNADSQRARAAECFRQVHSYLETPSVTLFTSAGDGSSGGAPVRRSVHLAEVTRVLERLTTACAKAGTGFMRNSSELE